MGDIDQLFVDNGAVEELEFNDELSISTTGLASELP